jgi:hypothetical protein
LPWDYIERHRQHHDNLEIFEIPEDLFDGWNVIYAWFFRLVILATMLILSRILCLYRKASAINGYKVLGEADGSVKIEKLPLRQS